MSLILVLALRSAPLAPSQTSRSLPDDNLAYPVLIKLSNGDSGSGFFFKSNTAVYLVTAKHVLFDPNTQQLRDTRMEIVSYSKDLSEATPNITAVDLATLAKENVVPHPSQDVAVVRLFSIITMGTEEKFADLPGVKTELVSKAGLLCVGFESVKRLNQVLVGNDVIVFGYPTSLGLKNVPQIDSQRPLLRKGLVAGVDMRRRSIVLDCPSYPGNSGGPVVEADPEGFSKRFLIIGVISQYVPYADGGKSFALMANSGYSIAVPVDFVLELVK